MIFLVAEFAPKVFAVFEQGISGTQPWPVIYTVGFSVLTRVRQA